MECLWEALPPRGRAAIAKPGHQNTCCVDIIAVAVDVIETALKIVEKAVDIIETALEIIKTPVDIIETAVEIVEEAVDIIATTLKTIATALEIIKALLIANELGFGSDRFSKCIPGKNRAIQNSQSIALCKRVKHI